MPPMMVAAARDTPGTMLTHWMRPIRKACVSVTSSSSCEPVRRNLRSIASMKPAPTIRATATANGIRSSGSRCFLNNRASTTVGTIAKKSLVMMCRRQSHEHGRNVRAHRSRQK
jgi:hypothetical protein